VGGYFDGGSRNPTSQVIDIANNRVCTSVPDYPVFVSYSTGAVIDGKPTICGRLSSLPDCYAYNVDTNEWEVFPSMVVGRDWHAGSVLNNGPWVITGGDSTFSIGESYEYFDGTDFVQIATSLPERLYGHCQVLGHIPFL